MAHRAPNAIEGKDALDLEIYGMEGVPEEDKEEFYARLEGRTGSGDDEDEDDEESIEELRRKIAEADAALAAISPPAKRQETAPQGAPAAAVGPSQLPYIPPQQLPRGPISFSLKSVAQPQQPAATASTTTTTTAAPTKGITFSLSFAKQPQQQQPQQQQDTPAVAVPEAPTREAAEAERAKSDKKEAVPAALPQAPPPLLAANTKAAATTATEAAPPASESEENYDPMAEDNV